MQDEGSDMPSNCLSTHVLAIGKNVILKWYPSDKGSHAFLGHQVAKCMA